MLTTEQMKSCEKDVTRRIGWKLIKAGDLLMACVKCQGLGKGGKIERIHPIEITSATAERLFCIAERDVFSKNGTWLSNHECTREGFPDLSGGEFIGMFMNEMNCHIDTWVNRIEFKHRKDLMK